MIAIICVGFLIVLICVAITIWLLTRRSRRTTEKKYISKKKLTKSDFEESLRRTERDDN